ncbi:unnamed protein product [Phaedon cochleariae]|uniref:Uncharacterized protein n=1 Tax=Phaedon cochleariae TaxID=80249 RepID=A0A9N9WX17_PHACE|nr:unnamed protein product [Phaedon cochleariae]
MIKALEFSVDLEIESRLLSSKSQTPEGRKYMLFPWHRILNYSTYHVGDKATRGPYYTDAFQMEHSCWLRFDYATVRTMDVTEEQVLKSQDTQVPYYLLFFRRRDTVGWNI